MLKSNSKIKQYAGRLGQLSSRGLSTIDKFEKKVNRFNEDYMGVPGDLYAFTPLKPLYESTIAPVKSSLRLTQGIAKAFETGKVGYAIKPALDFVDKYDTILKLPNMTVNPLYRIAQSRTLQQYNL